MNSATAAILVASDNAGDAEVVQRLLANAFGNVFVSSAPDKAIEDFESRQPDVLVLAFNSLKKAESYYLGLYLESDKIQTHRHRTVVLCTADDVQQVADLCVSQHFDDYALFWPVNHDAPRLVTSVQLAIQGLASIKGSGPSVREFAAQARYLSDLEALMQRQVSREAMPQHLTLAVEPVQALEVWADEFRRECAPHLEAARALTDLANAIPPVVLVVDDDEFQHKMIAKLLAAENYQLAFATSGIDALKMLRNSPRPDLILMDIMMPDLDGLEMTRRLKLAPQFAKVPVMMISGKSDGNIVLNCLQVGAVDFVVKPFEPEKLKAKVAKWSRPKPTPT